jgi:uncharacterized protein (DUF934 family)
MSRLLLADGSWRTEEARIVRDAAHGVSAGDLVRPAVYASLSAEQRAGVGLWFAPDDEPAQAAEWLAAVPLAAVEFPVCSDGRGYSIATLLRTRYAFRGDLRAVGDVLIDQLFYLRRVGFSSFALRADQEPNAAVAALRSFSDVYQASVDQPLPYFRRRAAVAGASK